MYIYIYIQIARERGRYVFDNDNNNTVQHKSNTKSVCMPKKFSQKSQTLCILNICVYMYYNI